MKTILFFIPNLGGGGAERVLVNLVNNLDRTKYKITVQTIFDVGVNKKGLKDHIQYIGGFKKVIPANTKIFNLFSPKSLYKKFIKKRYDVVVSYLEGPTARIVAGCPYKDTKLISWIHCKMENEQEASVGFRNFKEAKKCYNKFDNTVCVSKWVMDYFVNVYNFDKPIEVLYNTIETEEIEKKSCEKVQEIDFCNDEINICSVGKVVKVKGFQRLASIHKKLLDNRISNKVYILGVGDEREKIKKYLESNGIQDSFVFLGYHTNPYKYVRNCDLYVCSSYSEGFSTSVTEALVVGTPVVTTLCSGMQEMLGENNEYGIVTENNEDSLYDGIHKMLTTPGLLEHYKVKAQERGKYFSKDNTIKAVEKMLDGLFA